MSIGRSWLLPAVGTGGRGTSSTTSTSPTVSAGGGGIGMGMRGMAAAAATTAAVTLTGGGGTCCKRHGRATFLEHRSRECAQVIVKHLDGLGHRLLGAGYVKH